MARRTGIVGLPLALVSGLTFAVGAPPAASAEPIPPLPCGPGEDPSIGCGLRIVGSNDVLGRGTNLNLAKVGHCAYVSSWKQTSLLVGTPVPRDTDGVAVLDVGDPARPRLVSILRSPGALDSVETIDAVDTSGRDVLVVGAYGGRSTAPPLDPVAGPAFDVYDVTGDCTKPRLRSTGHWPDNAHNVTVNPAGTRIYGTRYAAEPKAIVATALNSLFGLGPLIAALPVPLTNVMVMDVADLARPRLLVDAPLILPDGSPTMCHKVELDAAERRMYCAGNQLSTAAEPDDSPPWSTWPDAGPSIWDVSAISRGDRNPVVRFVGESAVKGQGGHHAVPARVGVRRYLVAANELAFTCDTASFPRVWDITDERRPRVVSELRLRGGDACAGNHYNHVDDPERTTMAIVGWLGAGFRVFDLRDPARPRQVAWFDPGADCYSEAFLDPPTGFLWFACNDGFHVAELTPRVRAHLGLPGRPPTRGAISSAAWRAAPPDELAPAGRAALQFSCRLA